MRVDWLDVACRLAGAEELVAGLRSMIFALARICARRPGISEADMFAWCSGMAWWGFARGCRVAMFAAAAAEVEIVSGLCRSRKSNGR